MFFSVIGGRNPIRNLVHFFPSQKSGASDDDQDVPQGERPHGVGAGPPWQRPAGAPGVAAGPAPQQETDPVQRRLRAVVGRPPLPGAGVRLQGPHVRLGQVRQGRQESGTRGVWPQAGDHHELSRAADAPAGVLSLCWVSWKLRKQMAANLWGK